MKTITIKTNKREEVIDITNEINDFVKDVKEGFVLVYIPHASAGITINENDDPKVCEDSLDFFRELVPRGKWKHDKSGKCDRNNGDAHIKSSLVSHSETIPVKEGKLLLGKWQTVWLCEFDGPRDRNLIIQKWDAKSVN